MDLSVLGPELRDAVLAICRMVKTAGGRAFMVGGSVRDMMLGARSVKDVDLEVFRVPPDRLKSLLEKDFPFDPCGLSFGVLKIKHLDIDVSLPRRESKSGTGHRAFDVASDPSLSVAEAALRRDFTINAMYYDPLDDVFEDPHGGVKDLESRTMRHVSAKFVEDPLRVLRGMQFAARFELSAASETIALCRTIGMEGLPPERLFEEWCKLLVKGRRISIGLDFLRKTNWVKYFPELERLVGCQQDPQWHPEGDAWQHICLCLDSFAGSRVGDRYEDLVTGLAVLCHDLGKPATTRFVDGHIRSRGHDTAGLAPTLSFLRRLTNEERILREVPPLVVNHMQPFAMWKGNAKDGAVRRLALRVTRIDRLIRVCRADEEGRLSSTHDFAELEWLQAAAERLRIADSAPKPILMGRHLMELGYRPSPEFGKWLERCFNAQLDGEFFTLPEAIDYFRRMEK